MELTLDILKNDAFSLASLHTVVSNAPYIPGRLGQMAIFDSEPILTEIVHLYEEDDGIRLIPTTQRGEPDVRQVRDVGRLRALKTTRIAKKDTVRAGELMGLANMAFAESVRLRNAQSLVDKRLAKLKQEMEATKELHRFTAIQGILKDTDGSVIYNYWTQHGISTPPVVDINLGATAEADLLLLMQDTFLRPIANSLKDRAGMGVQIAVLAGDGLWNKLMRHPAVREIYKLQQTGVAIAAAQNPLMAPNFWNEVYFAGITWINYRGSTNGEIAVGANEGIVFPIGATDVFKVFWSPGETLLDITDPGRPEYPYIVPDPNVQMPSYIDIFLRSYPLYACIYPQCLMKINATG
jgi:hypothetical protein